MCGLISLLGVVQEPAVIKIRTIVFSDNSHYDHIELVTFMLNGISGTIWDVTVYTDYHWLGAAGTDSNVFITFIGEKGQTGRMHISSHGSRDDFEQSAVDDFQVDMKVDIGKPYRIRVELDNTVYTYGSDWKLDKVCSCMHIWLHALRIDTSSYEQ
jgi:hypothetical protein